MPSFQVFKAMLVSLLLAYGGSALAQVLVAPSSAAASDETSWDYGVDQTINGGGLQGTTLGAAHDLVTQSGYSGKFWISTAQAPSPITLTYNFASAPTLAGVGIWNAGFELPAGGNHYEFDGAPSSFDLQVEYAGGTKTYSGATLQTSVVTGQRFDFCENLAGVTQIRFVIKSDTRPVTGVDRNVYLSEFRGLQQDVPSCGAPLPGVKPPPTPVSVPVGGPAVLWLMVGGLAWLARRKLA